MWARELTSKTKQTPVNKQIIIKPLIIKDNYSDGNAANCELRNTKMF